MLSHLAGIFYGIVRIKFNPFVHLNQNGRKSVNRLTLNMIPRELNRFSAQFMVIRSRDHNQCHSQRVDETALRYGRAQHRAVISQITPEGNVPEGEVYERSRNLGHDSIKSTPWDLERLSPLLSFSVCEKIGQGNIIGIYLF